MTPEDLLRTVSRYVQRDTASSATRPARLATIDPAYTSGRPRVIPDGESAPSGKRYPYLASYTPAPGDRVLMIPVGTSYVIVGRVI